MKTDYQLFERVSFAGRHADRIDRVNKVIRGVKIVGLKSRNTASSTFGKQFADSQGGYEYAPQALKDAIPLYENATVNLDHVDYQYTPDGKRQTSEHSIRDRFGRLKNVRFDKDGLYGDLEYLDSHPHTPLILEAAERMPETLSLSHHAEGRPEKRPDGRVVVTKINRVRSVDLIGGRPGTNTSLFESESEATMSTAAPTAQPKEAHEHVHDALMGAICSIAEDDTIDTPTKLLKIKAILKAEENAVLALTGDSSKQPSQPATKPAKPAKPVQEQDNGLDNGLDYGINDRKETMQESYRPSGEELFESCLDDGFRDSIYSRGVLDGRADVETDGKRAIVTPVDNKALFESISSRRSLRPGITDDFETDGRRVRRIYPEKKRRANLEEMFEDLRV